VARYFRYFEKKRGHRSTGSRLFGSVGEAIFFTVLLVVGCAGVLAGILWLIVPEWRVNHGFVEISCKVVEKRTAEVQSEKGLLYRPEVKIDYEVQGVTYSPSDVYDVHHSVFSSREKAEASIERFKERQSSSCWYDPLDPKTAVLVRGYQWWIWPALLIPASFVIIGIGGLVYTLLHWGKSAERRAAAARSVPAAELFDRPVATDPKFPYIPDGSEITSSPGTRLAYRLPLTQSPGWTLFGLLMACIAWNGAVSVFVVMAARSLLAGSPDWLMFLFIVPFLGVGIALVVVFARLLRRTAGIGPTLVEISDHPLLPGNGYRVFLSQSGNLTLKTIEALLTCEEEAVFLQGTNARTESREVYRQSLYTGATTIRPGEPFEVEFDLPIPGEAMHSFRANHNQIQWRLIVHGEVVGWPGFQRSFAVVVRPQAAAQRHGVRDA
jgi:hypothetical protein